jgi:Flp pilus assembly pilin Flp
MRKLEKKLKARKNQRGQGMTEYIIITGLVAILLIAAVGKFQKSLNDTFEAGTKAIDSKITQPINNVANGN